MKTVNEIKYAKDLLYNIYSRPELPLQCVGRDREQLSSVLCALDWVLDGGQADKLQDILDRAVRELEERGCTIERMPAAMPRKLMNRG